MRNGVARAGNPREYDFSKGERGKFSRPRLKLNLPVYLDDEVVSFVQSIARRQKTDASSVVNELLRNDMELAKTIR
jgi:hypothetical protein